MQNTDFLDTNLNSGGMSINTEIRGYLKETAKWGKFIAIVGFVMMALLVIFALFAGTVMATAMSQLQGMEDAGAAGAVGSGMITFIYILMAMLYFFPLLYLYRFSTKIQAALQSDDQYYLSEAFRNLKSLYKFMGIMMMVMLGFYAVGLLLALAGGAFAMLG